ncbi:hypothetical protein [Poriferisphaera sp. WC338]|uniref:hypothetical protein n=1 Tax=Poriferisphaera sp. WC338 TaxID=3425129 RepID=UPI003D8134BA
MPQQKQTKQRSRRKTIVLLVLAALMLSYGSYLIHDHYAAIPPDPLTANNDDILGFLVSKHFANLPQSERQKYILAMAKRYYELSPEQREVAEQYFHKMNENNPDQMKERMIMVWKDFAVREASLYTQLPEEQRMPWLKKRIQFWRSMGGLKAAPGPLERDKRRKQLNDPLTPEKQVKIVSFFQKEVMPRTSARDRAIVTIMAKDAVKLLDKP